MAFPEKVLRAATTLSSEQTQQQTKNEWQEKDGWQLGGAAGRALQMPRRLRLMGRTIDSLPTYDKTIIPASGALG
ncbi:hypothetical protein N5D09_03625 [Stutzerimonas stutzeri]|jgi:hypothetical protein|uniref:Uncharacterized protein n=1 Tax=Stutzerimonas stutzeri TaxID=316 RepID=A0ABD4XWW0_STUST|nr:hypothetical protein [Stutzerimonas stutzeri]MCF0019187.1 hypothetical protein [Stutzerimonas stutzeri]MDH0687178.1 hypothetical protein [Stutzerimonas stutzeri]